MKVILVLLALGAAAPAFADSIFDKIGDDSDYGNGGSKIEKYKELDKKELDAYAKKSLKKEYWKNCGPWKEESGRRESISRLDKMLEKLAKDSKEKKSKAAEQLRALYDNHEIASAASAISNNEIDCSLSWFDFYGTDGTVLKMRYNLGD